MLIGLNNNLNYRDSVIIFVLAFKFSFNVLRIANRGFTSVV